MRWDFVIPEWVDRLLNDAALVQLLKGPHIYPPNATRPVRVPSIEYDMIYDRATEIFNPIGVQVNIFAEGMRLGGLIEKRIRLLTHHDVGQELGGERMWLIYQDSSTVEFPSMPGVIHRIVEFEFTPARGYAA
jgi:hypothetical protein